METHAATSRCSSAWPPGWARPCGCSQEGRAELEAGRDVVIGLLETHGRADTRAPPTGLERLAAAAHHLPRLDARGARPPRRPRARAGAVPDRRAGPHQRAGRRARQALRGRRATCSTPGIDVFSTMNVQHLESLNDNDRRALGRARARDRARLGAPARRRDRARRPHARGAAGAAAGGQGLPGRAHRRGAATASSRSRTSARCARPRCARSPRRSRRGGGSSSRADGARGRAPRRSASGCSRWSSPTRAPSGWCAGRGARRSGSGADLDLLWVAPAGRPTRGRGRPSARCTRCASSPRCSAPSCWSRRATTSPRPPRACRAERGTTYILLGASRPARGLARLREPLAQRLVRLAPGVDVRIVADRSRRRLLMDLGCRARC